MTGWKPGRKRAERAFEVPFDGVPEHLRQPLWNWIQAAFGTEWRAHPERPQEVAMVLRVPLRGERIFEQANEFLLRCNADDGFMLDLVETLLELYGWDDGRAGELELLLVRANSAYTVNDSYRSLEERIATGVRETVRETIDAASGSPGEHLLNAWNAAYGRASDPVKSYAEAIKAVEAALAANISPQNAKQTLGTMIKDVEQKPAKWKFEIDSGSASGVETMLAMMKLLWKGQTSRHGGLAATRAESVDEARAAVHLAATLVQLGVSDAFQKA